MSARVLVVDDVPPNVKLLEAKLTSEYFDVISATSGEEALEAIEKTPPDIVLLDVMMPGMDGFEVCRRIKGNPRTAHIPVVMVTALDHPKDRVTGLEAGADDFLTKPVHDIALFARVRSLVRLKMLMDELRMREATGQALGFEDDLRTEINEPVTGARILLIDDQERSASRVAEALVDMGEVQIDAGDAGVADRAAANFFDLIIVSMGLANADGLRVCSQIRSIEATRHVPILIIVDENNSRELIRGLEIGINDYLVRPIDRNELVARSRTQIRRKRYSDRLRHDMHVNLQRATTDALTGLYNRHFLSGHLATALEVGRRTGKSVSLMVLDIDFFKAVNDSHGHVVGDTVLKEFADRMARNVRGIDLAARFGGEEFVVLLPDTDLGAALAIAERLRRETEAALFDAGGRQMKITVSIGVAESGTHAATPIDLIKAADEALYEAKRSGRNRVVTFNPMAEQTPAVRLIR